MSKTQALPRTRSWTEKPCREWFSRCDRCNRWQLVADYHEFYGQKGEDWWHECMNCSFATVTTWGEEWRTNFLKSLAEELENTTPRQPQEG